MNRNERWIWVVLEIVAHLLLGVTWFLVACLAAWLLWDALT